VFEIHGEVRVRRGSISKQGQRILPRQLGAGGAFDRTDAGNGSAMPFNLEGLASVLDLVQDFPEVPGSYGRADGFRHVRILNQII
jgi:hypothetical protein